MVLQVNTADNKKTIVKLGKTVLVKERKTPGGSQDLLILIDQALKKEKLIPRELTAIKINLGPGSFTGLRVGTAVANALAFSLDIPINNRKIGKLIEPMY